MFALILLGIRNVSNKSRRKVRRYMFVKQPKTNRLLFVEHNYVSLFIYCYMFRSSHRPSGATRTTYTPWLPPNTAHSWDFHIWNIQNKMTHCKIKANKWHKQKHPNIFKVPTSQFRRHLHTIPTVSYYIT